MRCRSSIVNGRRCDSGDDGFTAILRVEYETTDDEEVTAAWGIMPANGDTIVYRTRTSGVSADGATGFYRLEEGTATRQSGTVVVWSTANVQGGYSGGGGGTPAGWAGSSATTDGVADDLRLSGQGAAGAGVVRWTHIIEVIRLLNGASVVEPDIGAALPPPPPS
jgi:hypothetical protein